MRDENTQVDQTLQKESLRKQLHAENEHGAGGHGGTEMGWLVSYADMMTLLFGLFVILYSLASQKKGDIEETLKGVSQKYFQSQTANPPPVQSPESVAPAPTPQTEEPPVEQQPIVEQSEQTPEPPIVEAAREPTSEKVEEQKDKIKNLERKIAQTEKTIENVSKENQELKEQIEKISAEKATPPPTPQMQNYMMVVLTWETDKHDLDLSISNPHQKIFDFKRRKIKNEQGEFVLDSRYGPGLEMWRSISYTEGEYKASARLYHNNGNTSPAIGYLSIITNTGTFKLPPFELSSKQNTYELLFRVKSDGTVEY